MVRSNDVARSILAGVFISIGGIAYLRSGGVVGSFLFSVGLLGICTLGLHLYTGKVSRVATADADEIGRTMVGLIFMWIGNFLGCWVTAAIMEATRFAHHLRDAATAIVDPKLNDGPMGLFVLGIGCNILIYTAVTLYQKHGSIIGTVGIILSVVVFINCGFEHCIADAFYMTMGDYSFSECLAVLVPVTLGNTVGGIVPAMILECGRNEG